jgi:Ca2+-binding RTX toxin-like protein
MPNLIASGEFAIRMDQSSLSSLWFGVGEISPNLIRFTDTNGVRTDFIGNFLFDGFVNLAGGTITGFSQFFNGRNIYTGSGFNQSATQFLSWVNTNSSFTAFSTMLSGDDILVGSPFDDYLIGYGGNDHITAGQGFNTIDGSAGFDTISYADATVGVTVNLSLTTSQSTGWSSDTLFGIERIVGSGFNDILTGSSVSDELIGGTGNDQLSGGSGNDLLDGGVGNDVIIGGAGDDSIYDIMGGTFTVDGGAGVDFLVLQSNSTTGANFSLTTALASGSSALNIENIYLYGNSHADRITGASAADYIAGFNGNDVLTGLAGNDILDGGAGFDAALYSGVRRQYVANSTSVSGNGEGTDRLISIEEARFVDGVLTFDASSASAQVMRLYSATLNRVPDQGGLEANTGALGTLGLQGLANTFVASVEFQARFGALNNQQFVEQLYVFALGRTGDAPGIASWVALLNGGASRGQVVVGFSESAENIGRTAATLNAGLWVPDPQALIIARLYDATFKRLPDVEGLAGWVNALKGGTSQEAIAAAFAGSAEFQATFGALSNQAFVEQLYRFCLNREGDAGGIAGWVNALNNGTSRASVLLGFSESAEHVALTANLWLGGIRFAGFVGAPAEDVAKDMDGPQILPDVEDIDIAYDPADLGLSFLDKDADAFVLPAVPDMPLPTVDPADPSDGLDLAALRLSASRDARMMLTLPESVDLPTDFDLDAWSPAQRDGHWLM